MKNSKPLLALSLLTTLTLATAAHASNGGERGGRPLRLFLTCESAKTDPCQTSLEIAGLVGSPPTASIHRDCRGERKVEISEAPVTMTPADFSRKPYKPLVYRGHGFRISAISADIPDFENPEQPTLTGRLELPARGRVTSQELSCRGSFNKDNVILPTFHRERIVSIKLLKNEADPYASELEISYYRHCGDSHLHAKLNPVLEGNETHCDEHGNCFGSTGKLVGVEAEILATGDYACQAADTLETVRKPLGDVMVFHDLPLNGVEDLKFVALQPKE